jgi:hypothetical protein
MEELEVVQEKTVVEATVDKFFIVVNITICTRKVQ